MHKIYKHDLSRKPLVTMSLLHSNQSLGARIAVLENDQEELLAKSIIFGVIHFIYFLGLYTRKIKPYFCVSVVSNNIMQGTAQFMSLVKKQHVWIGEGNYKHSATSGCSNQLTILNLHLSWKRTEQRSSGANHTLQMPGCYSGSILKTITLCNHLNQGNILMNQLQMKEGCATFFHFKARETKVNTNVNMYLLLRRIKLLD